MMLTTSNLRLQVMKTESTLSDIEV